MGKFNELKTISLIKNEEVFLLYNARLYKFKALQTNILR
jgi:hypothetical protein